MITNLDSINFEKDLIIPKQIMVSKFPEKIVFEKLQPRTALINAFVWLHSVPKASF
jgi:hypothetical protein